MSELCVYVAGPVISMLLLYALSNHPHRYSRFSVSGKLSSRIVLTCLFHKLSGVKQVW